MNGKAKKIVLIENDAIMIEMIARKLTMHGIRVKAALDGRGGLELALKEKPDLIILELLLPKMNGFTVMESIRHNKNQDVAKTPIVILSNLWSREDQLRAQTLNPQAYLIKANFTTEEILAKINEVLESKLV